MQLIQVSLVMIFLKHTYFVLLLGLCNSMIDDLTVAKKIAKSVHKNNLYIVRYEDLVGNVVESAQHVYK